MSAATVISKKVVNFSRRKRSSFFGVESVLTGGQSVKAVDVRQNLQHVTLSVFCGELLRRSKSLAQNRFAIRETGVREVGEAGVRDSGATSFHGVGRLLYSRIARYLARKRLKCEQKRGGSAVVCCAIQQKNIFCSRNIDFYSIL